MRAQPTPWPRTPLLRLGVALALSVALHVSIIYGVTVVPPRAAGDALVIHALVTPVERDPSSPAIAPVRERRMQGLRPDKTPPAALRQKEAEPAAVAASPPPVAPATALPKVEMPLLADPTWYPAKQLDVYPRLLAPVHPRYPDAATRDNIGGAVMLLLMVDENGFVRDADVAEADPPGYFEEEALAAFREARFTPAARDGRPVRSRILVRVTFSPEARAQARE